MKTNTLKLFTLLTLLSTTALTQNLKSVTKNDTIEKVVHFEGGITVWRQTTANYIYRSQIIADNEKLKTVIESNHTVVKKLNNQLDINKKTYIAQVDSVAQVVAGKQVEIDKTKKKIKTKNRIIYAVCLVSVPTLIQLGELIAKIIK